MRNSKTRNSVIVNEKSCTILIGIALCVWLIGGLLYLFAFNGNNGNFSGNNGKYSFKNVGITSRSFNSEYIVGKGWEDVYFLDLHVRMPMEQHEYIMKKYWIPEMKQRQLDKKKDDIQIELNNDASLEEEVEVSEGNDEGNDDDNMDDSEVASDDGDEIVSENEWSNPCKKDVHDNRCVLKQMKYWVPGVTQIDSAPQDTGKYVTFLRDCGGFNNIRQGFEFHVMVAWITKRTLVLPPDTPWYLIDFGHITRGKYHKNEILGHREWKQYRIKGVSNFDIFFSIDDMRKAVNVITTQEFIKREKNRLNIPKKFHKPTKLSKFRDEYIDWLTNKAKELHTNLPWGQLKNVLMWPSIKDVESSKNPRIDGMFIDNRKKCEYTSELQSALFIHFPACKFRNPSTDGDYRYLGQIARSIAFSDDKMDRKYKQILRDHVHLNDNVMEYASKVVSILGAYSYVSLHIRRNDLQYKYVWCSGDTSYNNIKPLIYDNEIIYISTDETNNEFFDVFKDNGKHKVYRWHDFFGKNAIFEETKNIKIPSKLHGEVEMAITAMSRIFFGTKESTFSSYIGRLRGYFNAPNTQTLYHHYQCTSNIDESSKIAKSNPGKPYAGQIYKIPFPDLWEDIKDISQFI